MIDIPLDFSAISQLYCARAYQLSCVRGIDGTGDAAAFGNAVHKYLEYKALGKVSSVLALCTELAAKYNCDLTKLLMVATKADASLTFDPPILDTCGTPLVEYKFSIPYKVVGDYRIVLCGTVDRIYLRDKVLLFQDYKTTAATGAAGERITSEYVTSMQLPFYLYIIHKYLHHFLPSPLDELAYTRKICGYYTMIYHSLVPPKIENTVSINLTDADVLYIEELIDLCIPKMIAVHQRQTLCPPEGSLYKMCPKCNFKNLCIVKENDRLIELINRQPTRIYDPTNFR